MRYETRIGSPTEMRFDGGRPVIEGYAAVFGKRSMDMWGFVEEINPKAFDRTLRENPDIRAFVEHDAKQIVGRTKSGTLELRVDSKGLATRIYPPDTQTGRDLMTSVSRGDLDQMSFAFISKDETTRKDADGIVVRELLDVDLFEVSVVAIPAYPDTEAVVVSRDLASLLNESHRMQWATRRKLLDQV